MNNLFKIFLIFQILISGCNTNTNTNTNKLNEQKISQSIDTFNMNIFSNKGNKIFTVKSPYSIYDRAKDIIKLKKTTIHTFKDNKVEYIINSDKSTLSNNNKILELNGNVIVKSLLQNEDELYANSFNWNINNSEYLLIGNVKLENNSITLSSNKAILHKRKNIVEFFNPVKYVIKNNNKKDSYEINSENAFYNIDTQTVSFTSVKERVRSKVYF